MSDVKPFTDEELEETRDALYPTDCLPAQKDAINEGQKARFLDTIAAKSKRIEELEAEIKLGAMVTGGARIKAKALQSRIEHTERVLEDIGNNSGGYRGRCSVCKRHRVLARQALEKEKPADGKAANPA